MITMGNECVARSPRTRCCVTIFSAINPIPKYDILLTNKPREHPYNIIYVLYCIHIHDIIIITIQYIRPSVIDVPTRVYPLFCTIVPAHPQHPKNDTFFSFSFIFKYIYLFVFGHIIITIMYIYVYVHTRSIVFGRVHNRFDSENDDHRLCVSAAAILLSCTHNMMLCVRDEWNDCILRLYIITIYGIQ